MAPGQEMSRIPIIGQFIERPPSPILIGTVAVLTIVVLVVSPWYAKIPGPGNETVGKYITLGQLLDDYGQSTYNFRSYEPGDSVLIRDTVTRCGYISYGNSTELSFSKGEIYVYGNVVLLYPAGTTVIFVIKILGDTNYESWQNRILPKDIWSA